MNVAQFFQTLIYGRPLYTGVIPDARTIAEKDKDYAHEERLASAVVADYFTNEKIIQSPYFYENQWYVGSCVPHGVGLALAIERFKDTGKYVRIAQLYPYRKRYNYPAPGSYMPEQFQYYKTGGAPLFTTLPTVPGMSEDAASAIKLTTQMANEAIIFAGKEFYTLKTLFNDINTLAGIAAQGHGVPMILFATYEEWSQEYPQIINPKLTYANAQVQHCVTILQNSGFTENGIRYVVIQDSAWFGARQLRCVSEAFISKRVTSAGYWDTVAELGGGAYPHYTFSRNLKVGDTGPDVIALQQLLIAEKLLPADCATGNFYGRTLAALHAFQNRYAEKILTPLNLDKPTDTFGSMSMALANLLCK